ncbi:MAG TPA: serine hydrolase, partial [Gemmatimonadales bacterium]|nr:serine hydrolase [Gemmatimonadales bacterium]
MIRSFVRALAWLVLPGVVQAQDVSRALRRFLPRGDTVVAIAFVQPATGRHAFLEADLRLHAASTMKVPVLVELARRVDAGELRWEDRLPVENRFHSIADSADFSVDAGDDSDSLPYTWIGASAAVADLARHMIARSSNLSTNILIQRLGADRVDATAHALGADSITVLRGVEDGAAYRRGLNNTLTARALGTLLVRILEGKAASAAGTQRILSLLTEQ